MLKPRFSFFRPKPRGPTRREFRHPKRRPPLPRSLGVMLGWFVGGLFALLLGVLVGFRIWSPHVIQEFNRVLAGTSNNTLVYDRYDQLISTIAGLEDRHTVPIAQIHPYLQMAVVAVEDRRFFAHRGMDPIRLLGALWVNFHAMAYEQGGSTITQQLVKLSLLSPERTLTRKTREIFMALALELEFPKLKLLEFYLNRVYLGFGIYGVEKASQEYFQKPASELELKEAAFLAALIKKPEGYLVYSRTRADAERPTLPVERMTTLLGRVDHVLATLGDLKWLSQREINRAFQESLVVYKPTPEVQTAPYFVQQALRELKHTLGVSQVAGKGFRVYTTLDPAQQEAAESMTARLAEERPEGLQGAMVALEPATGFVRALVGGVDFNESQFNRATQAVRQPGSAFKPLVYAAAIEHGFQPNMLFVDEPIRYVSYQGHLERLREDDPFLPAAWQTNIGVQTDLALPPDDREQPDIYAPRNYNERYGSREGRSEIPGEDDRRMTLARALELSSNVIAVQVLDRLGILPVERLARRFGITVRPGMGLCIALGCSETTLLDLTAAYATFANGGVRARPVFIRRVTNSQGDELYAHYPDPPEQVLSPWSAFQMNRMLGGVIHRGTGWRARLDRPVGGKTGTNDGPRDAWFVGFTPTLVAGVWIGNDDNAVIPGETGGRMPAKMWKGFMTRVLPPYEGEAFPIPAGDFVAVRTCTISGQVANEWCPASTVYHYREGDSPLQVCTVHPLAARRAIELEPPIVETGEQPAPVRGETAPPYARRLDEAFGALTPSLAPSAAPLNPAAAVHQ